MERYFKLKSTKFDIFLELHRRMDELEKENEELRMTIKITENEREFCNKYKNICKALFERNQRIKELENEIERLRKRC